MARPRTTPRPPEIRTAARKDGLRRAVVATAQAMSRTGLSPGTSGNVSARVEDGMLITASGLGYETMVPADVVHVRADGSVAAGALAPSSEWRFHLSAYAARADIGAIVHTHSPKATALACAHRPIPAFHYMVAVAGGVDIPLIPYATFGTEALAAHVATGLANRDACLMANHGQIAAGRTLDRALALAREVETLAAQYIDVLALGPPHILTEADMADVLARFATYGQRAGKGDRS